MFVNKSLKLAILLGLGYNHSSFGREALYSSNYALCSYKPFLKYYFVFCDMILQIV